MPVVLEKVGSKIVVRDPDRKQLASLLSQVPEPIRKVIEQVQELHRQIAGRVRTP